MSNEITEFIDLSIEVADLKISKQGFGVILLLPEENHSAFTTRTQIYNDIDEVLADFAVTTKTYKAASAIFSQKFPPSYIKIGRADSGDASLTATLAAINNEDPEWYCLIAEKRLAAEILEIAAWIETKSKIYVTASEDSGVIDSGDDTDIASSLEALDYNRTYYKYHHEAGVDVGTVTISVSSGTATVTKASHTVRAGDAITILGATPSALNGNQTVLAVTSSTFTYSTTASDGAATGTITCAARFTFPDAAMASEMIGRYFPGEATWKFKQLVGIEKTPTSLMNSAQKAAAIAKNANVYVEVASVGITQNGVTPSGRFMDITVGMDYIYAQITERIFTKMAALAKIPFTNAGAAIIENEIRAALDEGIERNILTPLLDDPNNLPYIVSIPDVADVSEANRIARNLPDITFSAQLAGAVHTVVIRGKVSV